MENSNELSQQNDYQAKLKASFNRFYQYGIDGWTTEQSMRAVIANVVNVTSKYLKPSVLDIGCGKGLDSASFASIATEIYAIDFIKHENWDVLAKKHTNIVFVEDDYISWKALKSFDIIWDNGCFHHQNPNNYVAYLAKVYQLLNAKGTYIVSTFFDGDSRIKQDPDERLHKYFDKNEIQQLLQSIGLVCLQQFVIYRDADKDGDYLVTVSIKDTA